MPATGKRVSSLTIHFYFFRGQKGLGKHERYFSGVSGGELLAASTVIFWVTDVNVCLTGLWADRSHYFSAVH